MSKFATKAASNMFCQARYEAAKSNERLSSREGAAEEIGIDRTRLARIELGSTIPYQEEVLLMLSCSACIAFWISTGRLLHTGNFAFCSSLSREIVSCDA